jgi:hypothetical protein
MKLPEKVKDIFNDELVYQLATSSKNGIPNISNAGAKYLLDDETIIIVDNYMVKTLSNVIENPAVSVLLRSGKESYQIKGSCSYFTSGALYEEVKKWMKSIGEKYPAKGVLKIRVEDIYSSNSGAGAGELLKDSDK